MFGHDLIYVENLAQLLLALGNSGPYDDGRLAQHGTRLSITQDFKSTLAGEYQIENDEMGRREFSSIYILEPQKSSRHIAGHVHLACPQRLQYLHATGQVPNVVFHHQHTLSRGLLLAGP